MSLRAGRNTDEPSVFADFGKLTLVLWYGSIRDWRLGAGNCQHYQNPHWRMTIGFITFIWRTYP